MTNMSVENFYRLIASWSTGNNTPEVQTARLVFDVRTRFNSLWDYDPVTGEALSTDIYTLLSRYRSKSNTLDDDKEKYTDRLKQIVDYAEPALEYLMHQLHNRIIRNHAVLPLHAVRKTDAKTVRWLNSKPGRNVREKLAGSPRMLAVEHRQSFDTTENRLLKAYVLRICELLELRQRAVNALHPDISYTDDLVLQLHRWLRSDIAQTIGRWENLPPNNTLLSDQHYRKVWRSWCHLQQLDADIQNDFRHLQSGRLALMSVSLAAYMQRNPSVRLVQQPVMCDYDIFGITPALEKVFGYARNNKRNFNPIEVELRDSRISLSLPDSFLRIPDDWFVSKPDLTTVQNDELVHRLLEKKKLPVPPPARGGSGGVANALDSVILDVTELQPGYLGFSSDGTNTQEARQVPFRLVQQYWKYQTSRLSGEFEVDCCRANALQQDTETYSIETLTMRDVINSNASQYQESRTTSVGRLFAKKLAGYFSDPKLCTYLIPDSGDDFSLELVRKSMNFGFRIAEPLPRSIAQVIGWQQGRAFDEKHVQDGDVVLVSDKDGAFCTIIPLKAKYSSIVEKKLPHTKGITWERLPPYELTAGRKQICKQGENSVVPYLLETGFSDVDLETASERLTVRMGSGESYHVSVADISVQMQAHSAPEYNKIRETYGKDGKIVHELSVETSARLLTGAHILQMWQKQVPEVSLWRDHLPRLAMQAEKLSGEMVRIELVGDSTTVAPKRGESVNIPVSDGFILPEGKTFYEFPLVQGDEQKKKKYYAYLHHAEFPLSSDVQCRLELVYTYGADTPYNLRFVPVQGQEADFSHIQVAWHSKSRRDWLNLPSPVFPQQGSWDDLTHFPGTNKKGQYSPLNFTGQWLPSEFRKIEGVSKFGWTQYILSPTRKTKKGDNFWIIEQSNEATAIVFEDKVLKAESATPLAGGERVYAYVIENKKGNLQAVDVSRNPQPNECFLAGSIRFPALTVWNHGRSLQDADAPNDFRIQAMRAISNAEKMIADEKIPKIMKNEMRRFLSYVHKDAPLSYTTELQKCIHDENLFKQRYKDIEFAIGDARLDWQFGLLEHVVTRAGRGCSKALEVLAVSLWRNKDVVFHLEHDQVSTIIAVLSSDFSDIQAAKGQFGKEIEDTITKRLELLLALCRLRDSDNEDLKKELSPHYSSQFRKLQDLIEKPLGKAVDQNEWLLKSRLSFELTSKEESVPDILYAARMYVSGREESNSIKIVKVKD